jgi:hypothetical protein
MAGYVGRLDIGDTLDATPYFAGQWRTFERRRLLEGTSAGFGGDRQEYSIFVTGGTGTFVVDSVRRAATTGTAITVGFGAEAEIEAGDEPVELFITVLGID